VVPSRPVGTLVGRYIRWFRNEWGATPATIRDYEAVLARMSFALADKEPYEVSVDDLRAVIDLWGDRTARTRQKITSVIRAFWAWAEDEGHIALSPAARIRRPRAERKVVRVLPATPGRRCCWQPRRRATGSASSVSWCSGCAAKS
jgi:site-specific recombinase XerD